MIEEINALAPQYFGVLPVADVEVRRVPAFREATSAAGYYNSPAGDTPGIYYLNLRSTQLIPTWVSRRLRITRQSLGTIFRLPSVSSGKSCH
jgi:uncharacterized protein (DUF885 family)